MVAITQQPDLVTFLPGLLPEDPWAAWWLQQATVRLRREVCWLWHERAGQSGDLDKLPPFTDRLSSTLDLTRHHDAKWRFFETDVTANYLSGKILEDPPLRADRPRGSFGWVIETLRLDDSACFALALGLLTAFDSA